MKIPEGYEQVETEPDGEEAVTAPASQPAFSVPEYVRVKKPPMLRGRERLCHSCYVKGLDVVDVVCPGCLLSLQQLGRIRMEIGQVYPQAMDLSLPRLMRGLFRALQKARGK